LVHGRILAQAGPAFHRGRILFTPFYMAITPFNAGESDNGVSQQKRMTDMTLTSLSAAAALVAACVTTTWAVPAFAAGESDAPAAAGQPVPDADHERGPGGHGPGGFGFGGHGPGAPGPDMPFDHMARLHGLKLSEAQEDKLFAIMHAQAPQRREHDKAIRKAHEALRDLGRADKFDDAKADAAARDLGQAVAADALQQARTEAQVRAVLTPEQREQLRQRRLRARDAGERPDGASERR
jgi:periplasmic protein CpxP/Spy